MVDISKELDLLKGRNHRVEADKAWETSSARVLTLAAITYVIAALLLYLIGNEAFWRNALVPTVGFYLSTQSLPAIKKYWLKRYYSATKD